MKLSETDIQKYHELSTSLNILNYTLVDRVRELIRFALAAYCGEEHVNICMNELDWWFGSFELEAHRNRFNDGPGDFREVSGRIIVCVQQYRRKSPPFPDFRPFMETRFIYMLDDEVKAEYKKIADAQLAQDKKTDEYIAAKQAAWDKLTDKDREVLGLTSSSSSFYE